MKMIFNYYANISHFHNKGFALSLVLKVRFFGTRKWPIEFAISLKLPQLGHPYRPYRLVIDYLTIRPVALEGEGFEGSN